MAKIVGTNKWKTVVANLAHVTGEGPADMVLGTHLMMQIAKVTKGVYVGFAHRNEEAIVKDMAKPQDEIGQNDLVS